MRLVDSHSHPQFPQYDADRDEVLERASAQGVSLICVGTDLEMSRTAVELARRTSEMWASVGLHPNDNLSEKFDPAGYRTLAADPKVVAVGEIGLDYYRTPDPALQQVQRERLLAQLDLARDLGKPVILHCRDAHADMQGILESYPDLRGVVHSFTGTWQDAQAYVARGFGIGLNGIVTFARQYDETVRNLPMEHLLLETDSPYLTPEPYRGTRNEPAYVREVARKIAELRNMSVEEVAEQTTENCRRLFGI